MISCISDELTWCGAAWLRVTKNTGVMAEKIVTTLLKSALDRRSKNKHLYQHGILF